MTDTVETTARIMAAGESATALAINILARGGPVGLPTETVYGLAADATNDQAVARIFEIKGRPSFNPLIVHVQSLESAEKLVVMDDLSHKLAAAFWPGPLTLVLPRSTDSTVSLLASAGLDTLAIRMPAHPVMQDVLTSFGKPLAAPSANPSGSISPTKAEHVARDIDVELVIDGGACAIGVESTIVRVFEGRLMLLRPGGVSIDQIEKMTGIKVEAAETSDTVIAPGQLTSHYAPRAALRLNATEVAEDEVLLNFGKPLRNGPHDLNLSAAGDAVEAAANLFAMMRTVDDAGVAKIAVMPILDEGLGLAINDRLRRAAAPRDPLP